MGCNAALPLHQATPSAQASRQSCVCVSALSCVPGIYSPRSRAVARSTQQGHTWSASHNAPKLGRDCTLWPLHPMLVTSSGMCRNQRTLDVSQTYLDAGMWQRTSHGRRSHGLHQDLYIVDLGKV